MRYKHLWAWDRMMGSNTAWSESMQVRAAKENAPEDAIYCRHDGGGWATYREIASYATKREVWAILNRIFGAEIAGPVPLLEDFPKIIRVLVVVSQGAEEKTVFEENVVDWDFSKSIARSAFANDLFNTIERNRL